MFQLKKNQPAPTQSLQSDLTPESLNQKKALNLLEVEESSDLDLIASVAKIKNLFAYIESKKTSETEAGGGNFYYEFEILKNKTLKDLIVKYLTLPKDYRHSVKIKDDMTAIDIFKSQLKNIEYMLVDMTDYFVSQEKKDFLVEAQHVTNKSSGVPQKELSALYAVKIAETKKNLEKTFVFYENLDLQNQATGKNNLKLVVIVLGVMVALGVAVIAFL